MKCRRSNKLGLQNAYPTHDRPWVESTSKQVTRTQSNRKYLGTRNSEFRLHFRNSPFGVSDSYLPLNTGGMLSPIRISWEDARIFVPRLNWARAAATGRGVQITDFDFQTPACGLG